MEGKLDLAYDKHLILKALRHGSDSLTRKQHHAWI